MASQDPTQSLLRWGIEHAEPGALLPLAEDMKAGRRPDLNTDVLKAIMGTTDADRMRECVQVIEGKWVDRDNQGIKDADVTLDDKLRAWDDLEMLIEDLDNANDLKNLGLWAPIVKHLTSDNEEVTMRACWVCGTAVQNNPRANAAFLEHDPLPTINSILTSASTQISTRNKAMYCLSSTLKHSPLAVARFNQLNGWTVLQKCLQDPSQTVRTKTVFLLSQLITQVPNASQLLTNLRTTSVLSTLIDSLSPTLAVPTGPNGDSDAIDADYRDKAVRFLVNVMETTRSSQDGGLTKEEKDVVSAHVGELERASDWNLDDVGLTQQEWDAFKRGLQA